MRRGSHHWHVIVDEHNRQTPAVIEHEHTVNRGRRHAHYHEYERVLAELLEAGTPVAQAKIRALRLENTAATTLDFARPPEPLPSPTEGEIARRLHPEVRRSLT